MSEQVEYVGVPLCFGSYEAPCKGRCKDAEKCREITNEFYWLYNQLEAMIGDED